MSSSRATPGAASAKRPGRLALFGAVTFLALAGGAVAMDLTVFSGGSRGGVTAAELVGTPSSPAMFADQTGAFQVEISPTASGATQLSVSGPGTGTYLPFVAHLRRTPCRGDLVVCEGPGTFSLTGNERVDVLTAAPSSPPASAPPSAETATLLVAGDFHPQLGTASADIYLTTLGPSRLEEDHCASAVLGSPLVTGPALDAPATAASDTAQLCAGAVTELELRTATSMPPIAPFAKTALNAIVSATRTGDWTGVYDLVDPGIRAMFASPSAFAAAIHAPSGQRLVSVSQSGWTVRRSVDGLEFAFVRVKADQVTDGHSTSATEVLELVLENGQWWLFGTTPAAG